MGGARWVALGCMVACVVTAAPVSADVSTQDAKRARKLFDDGRKQIAAEHVDAACELFATSLALDPQLGTRLNLASCREQQGRYIDAYTLYQDAAAEAARTGKASREELSGSTITISSLGPMGGIASTPVINRPEVAIVAVNKVRETVVVVDGELEIRKLMNLSLSCDHRVVDGWDAAMFMQDLKGPIENPLRLLSMR